MTVRRWAVWHPASEIDTSGRHESDPHPGSGPHASSVGDLLAHAARGAQDLGAAPILWPRCPRMSPARQQPISGSLSRRQRHWHRADGDFTRAFAAYDARLRSFVGAEQEAALRCDEHDSTSDLLPCSQTLPWHGADGGRSFLRLFCERHDDRRSDHQG